MPVFGAMLAAVTLEEIPTLAQIIGGALVLAGLRWFSSAHRDPQTSARGMGGADRLATISAPLATRRKRPHLPGMTPSNDRRPLPAGTEIELEAGRGSVVIGVERHG